MASLLLDTSRTFLEHGRAHIVVAVGKPVRLFVGVEGNATPSGMLAIEWDRSQAELVEGAERTPLPAGAYKSELTWVLRATYPGPFKVSIHATGGSLVQISVIPIAIIVQGKNL
ncbi:MAG: hypothetical protein ACREXW_19280 [Gammaproteobacteria bacterium]